MSAEEARAIVRRMYRQGIITSGEASDAYREIDRGRASDAVRYLRRLCPAVTEE